MVGISKKHIEILQGVMEAELARLVDEMQGEMDPRLKASFVDIDGDVADFDDEAVANTLIDIDNAIIGVHLEKARDLNAALDRIQKGSYGKCIECDDDIGFNRLSAYPTAKRCIKCQSHHEKIYAGHAKPSY